MKARYRGREGSESRIKVRRERGEGKGSGGDRDREMGRESSSQWSIVCHKGSALVPGSTPLSQLSHTM